VEVIRDLRHSFNIGRLQMCRADEWLNALLAERIDSGEKRSLRSSGGRKKLQKH